MIRTRPTPAPTVLAVAALIAVLGLAGCNRVRTHPATQATTSATTATPMPAPSVVSTDPALANTAATRPAPAANGPSCPSIGTLAETHGGPIALSGPTVVRLAPVCSAAAMTDQIRTYGAATRYILVADDLRVGVQPGVLFHLSFGAPTTSEPAVLGTLNFFAARSFGAEGSPHSVSYDVTRQMRSLAVSGWPADGLGVAIAPQGPMEPGAAPAIGAIRLVAQPPR